MPKRVQALDVVVPALDVVVPALDVAVQKSQRTMTTQQILCWARHSLNVHQSNFPASVYILYVASLVPGHFSALIACSMTRTRCK